MLQAHVRTLEQREISQMRQGAILQRKLDAAEQELRDRGQRRELEREQAVRARRRQREQRTSEGQRRCSEAARVLEAELLQRLEATRKDAAALERSVRGARAQRGQLEADLSFWRGCARELLREEEEAPVEPAQPASPTVAPSAASRAAELRQNSERLSGEAAALRQSCADLGARVKEVERIAHAARCQEAQTRERGEALAASAARAMAAASEAQARAQERGSLAEALCAKTAAQEARLEQEPEDAASLAGGGAPSGSSLGSDEEVAYLKRKIQERQREVNVLQEQKARLHAALQRHAGPEARCSGGRRIAEAGLEAGDYRGCCGAFDETVSRTVTLLFRSIFVRRVFCVHLFVLYGWLLFLLWWLSRARTASL